MALLLLTAALSTHPRGGSHSSARQAAGPTVSLRGAVKEFKVEQQTFPGRSGITHLQLEFGLELFNNGPWPLILLRRGIICPGVVIAQNESDLEAGRLSYLVFEYRGSSEVWSRRRESLRKKLEQRVPPPGETFTLKPGESWKFDASVHVPLDDKPIMVSPKRESFEYLRQHSPIWVQVRCATWPTYLTRVQGDEGSEDGLDFARRLQRRWEGSGLLWFDELASEPIRLDLSAPSPKQPPPNRQPNKKQL